MKPSRHRLRTWQLWSWLAAGAGAGVGAAICWENFDRFWPAYLYAYLACWLVCMGGMGLLALGNLTGGRWAAVGRPFYLAAAQTIPLVAILFIPIGGFAEHIYGWVTLTPGELPPAKSTYLDIVFFCARGAGYFAVWLWLARMLSVVSRLDLPPASTPAMRRVGAATLVLLMPTATFAAFDWGMSLEPEWYSSIYGALLSAGGVLAVHALAICALAAIGDVAVDAILRRAGHGYVAPIRGALQGGELHARDAAVGFPVSEQFATIFNDLGNLLLAFLMVCTYFAFSQFLIIWSANLPGEISWYLRRLNGGWQWLALVIVLLHFVVPFLCLLSRELKRMPQRLAGVAVLLLVMYFVHLYWVIVPAFAYHDLARHATNIAALVAVFGGWLGVFSWFGLRALQNTRSSSPRAGRLKD